MSKVWMMSMMFGVRREVDRLCLSSKLLWPMVDGAGCFFGAGLVALLE